MSRPSIHNPAAFLRDIEEKAAGFGLRALHLTDGSGRSQGLCLLRQELSAGDLLRLLTVPDAVAVSRQEAPSPALALDPLLRLFTVEAERVRRTRTPCALLLAGIDGYTEGAPLPDIYGTVIDLLRRQAEPIDVLGHMDGWLLGMVMPGANLGRAERRAAAIRRAVREAGLPGPGGKRATVSVAIAVHSAVHDESDAAFLLQVKDRLIVAMTRGRDQEIRIRPHREQDSCQVTLEERAQLLGELFS